MTKKLELTQPLFLGAEFSGIKKSDKKDPNISVRINLNSDNVIYISQGSRRAEVVAYEDPETNLFVTEVPGVEGPNIYNKFRIEAIKFAKIEIEKFIERLSSFSEEEYDSLGYKPLTHITNTLNRKLIDREDIYADIHKQVTLITSRRLPRVNEYLVFEDDEEVMHKVTTRVPYKNPRNQKLFKKDIELVDRILDTFMDDYNKRALTWYLGAALCNLNIHDDRVSKLAIISSSQGGSGKSSLANALVDALFTPNYREIKDEFDSFFFLRNQFGVSSLSAKRISVYSEAAFSNEQHSAKSDEEVKHDFTGMNVSVLKSLITEGYVSSEAKYSDRAMDQLNGFHLVLTNHPPVITEEHEAMSRRILPIMIYPSTMADKAKKLNLWGKTKFNKFVADNRQAFANYFVHKFLEDQYAFTDVNYDHRDYTEDIEYTKELLDDLNRERRLSLRELEPQGLPVVLLAYAEKNDADLDKLIEDITLVKAGGGSESLREEIRLDDKNMYINSSKNFFIQYTNQSAQLRSTLIDIYGAPIPKYQKRMLVIPLNKEE